MINENLLDDEIFNFLNNKFPMHSNDLRESLELLENVLQTTIDAVEDKSNEVIKKERNFLEANKYRQKENSLYMLTLKITKACQQSFQPLEAPLGTKFFQGQEYSEKFFL